MTSQARLPRASRLAAGTRRRGRHGLDPLARLQVSIDGQRAAYAAIHPLAHGQVGGRWLLTGGGGYDLVYVVPRRWTHLLAKAAGQLIDQGRQTPARRRENVGRRTGLTAPAYKTEGTRGVRAV